jgi:putative SOS response-associated peptidase YedK
VLAEEFGVTRFVNVDLRPRYNVAPSQLLETIIRAGSEKRLGPMRWGFIPEAAKDPKLAPINARSDNLFRSFACQAGPDDLSFTAIAEGDPHFRAIRS